MVAGKPGRFVAEDGSEVVANLEVGDGFRSRLLGLMGRGRLGTGEGLLLRPCNSIHTFFMRFPVDVAFLDDEGRILAVREGLKPWRVAGPVRGARSTLELPAGTLARAHVAVGGRLSADGRPRLAPARPRK